MTHSDTKPTVAKPCTSAPDRARDNPGAKAGATRTNHGGEIPLPLPGPCYLCGHAKDDHSGTRQAFHAGTSCDIDRCNCVAYWPPPVDEA